MEAGGVCRSVDPVTFSSDTMLNWPSMARASMSSALACVWRASMASAHETDRSGNTKWASSKPLSIPGSTSGESCRFTRCTSRYTRERPNSAIADAAYQAWKAFSLAVRSKVDRKKLPTVISNRVQSRSRSTTSHDGRGDPGGGAEIDAVVQIWPQYRRGWSCATTEGRQDARAKVWPMARKRRRDIQLNPSAPDGRANDSIRKPGQPETDSDRSSGSTRLPPVRGRCKSCGRRVEVAGHRFCDDCFEARRPKPKACGIKDCSLEAVTGKPFCARHRCIARDCMLPAPNPPGVCRFHRLPKPAAEREMKRDQKRSRSSERSSQSRRERGREARHVAALRNRFEEFTKTRPPWDMTEKHLRAALARFEQGRTFAWDDSETGERSVYRPRKKTDG